MSRKPKRARDIPLYVMVSPAEYDLIRDRMAEAGTTNMGAFVRKLALNGYVLHVDLSPVSELVPLQRYCANNMNQIAKKVNTYSTIHKEEITTLQKDYAELWGRSRICLSSWRRLSRCESGEYRLYDCQLLPTFYIQSIICHIVSPNSYHLLFLRFVGRFLLQVYLSQHRILLFLYLHYL